MSELNPIGLALPNAQSGADTQAATAGLADNYDTFLTLLTEQLQNQDPLSPLKSEEFVNQLVQFSGVEQQIASTDALQSLLSLNAATARMSAVDYIGKVATASTDQSFLKDGRAGWSYGLPREAAQVDLVIYDKDGSRITTIQGETGQGPHSFSWDGTDDAGAVQPDGTYRLQVVAKDAQGDTIDAPVRTEGVVDAVDMTGEEVIVQIGGGVTVPASQIIALRQGGLGL